MLFQRVAIVGTGLMGSSFGLAAKRSGLVGRVVGVSSPAVAEKALRAGAIDEVASHEDALSQADLVVLAQPIGRLLKTLELVDRFVTPGAIVTDVGSTKTAICDAGTRFIQRGKFIGGHPMAGKERRGPEASSAELFEGRTWILTEAHAALEDLLRAIGARPLIMSAEEHDRMVAFSSHLPQVLSTVLAEYLEAKAVDAVAGPGLRDMTRLALSSFDLWDDILATNRGNVDAALAGFIDALEAARLDLGRAQMGARFERGRLLAERIPRER